MVKISRKANNGSGCRRHQYIQWIVRATLASLFVAYSFREIRIIINQSDPNLAPKMMPPKPQIPVPHEVSYQTPLAYGTKDLKDRTGALVAQAIGEGFRHIVTCGHHQKHNESGVGFGWTTSGLDRHEIFLQTCFVPFGSTEEFQRQPSDPMFREDWGLETIEDQVHLSVSTSLKNLQTTYIDALIFHNFRAKRWDDNEMMRAWRVFEQYVDNGTIKYLGMTSVHDPEWFDQFYDSVRIPPIIVQNRFHSNRQYDVNMQEVFGKRKIQVQRFWLLNGSSGMGRNNKEMADAKNVTPAQLMLGFVMSGSETCLVGTTSLQHMKEDIEISKCYPSLFFGGGDNYDADRQTYAQKLGMNPARPLTALSSVGDTSRSCQSMQE